MSITRVNKQNSVKTSVASFHEVVDPATGRVVGSVQIADALEVDDAVADAQLAAHHWMRTSPKERSVILIRAAAIVRERLVAIAEVLTLEQGKPLSDSKKEILFGAKVLEYYGEEILRLAPDMRASENPDIRSIVRYAPIGVVGAIVPWNYPVDLWCWKVGPALAAGNVIVSKSPIEAPFAIGMMLDCLNDAGLPENVLQDLPGGVPAGAAMAQHPGIGMLSATCSTSAGREIMRLASGSLKRLTLELGGSSPFIVLRDADIENAAQAALRRSFSNAGQICIAVNRIIVEDDVADDFVTAMADLMNDMRLGNGSDPDVEYGPVTTKAVIRTTESHLSDALTRGAKLIRGGKKLQGHNFDGGLFYAPALIDHTPRDADVFNHETFGPLAAVHRVYDAREALEVANDSVYGLAAYVYSNDLEKAWSLAERLECGGVGVNVNDVSELQAPFGGWKLSGYGRELGKEGLLGFMNSQHIKLRVKNQFLDREI